jgi:hypothetical protein
VSIEVVVYEDDTEVERQNLHKVGYLIFTADNWHISSMKKWPLSGTAQFTVKRKSAQMLLEEKALAEPEGQG